MLFYDNEPGASAAIAEAKTYWSYAERHIRGALSTKTCDPATGEIDWDNNSIYNNIIRQVSIYVQSTGIL